MIDPDREGWDLEIQVLVRTQTQRDFVVVLEHLDHRAQILKRTGDGIDGLYYWDDTVCDLHRHDFSRRIQHQVARTARGHAHILFTQGDMLDIQ